MGCVQSIGREVKLHGTLGSEKGHGRFRSCRAARGRGRRGVLERAEELVNGQQERCRWHRKQAADPSSQFLKRNQRRRWRRRLLNGDQEVASAVCTGSVVVRSTRRSVVTGSSGPVRQARVSVPIGCRFGVFLCKHFPYQAAAWKLTSRVPAAIIAATL